MLKRLAALAAALMALNGSAAAEDVIRLGNLKFAHYGAVSYMKEIAPKYGVKIEENIFAKGADIYPAMASGSIDIAASASDGAIAARGNGVPLYTVAGFASGGARIVVRKDAGVRSIEDLKGKKAGVARGAAHEILLLAELEKHGLTWSDKPGKDVQIVYLGFAELNQALATSAVDAICQSEPQASIAISRGIGVELMKPYDTPVGLPVRLLVMTETLYRDKPDLAAKVMQIFVEATKAFVADKALAERYVREQMFKGSLTAEEYAAAMENAAFTTDVDPAQLDVTTGLMARYGLGKMANPPKSADWVKLDLLRRAKAQANVN
jgi:NitT/TauT family transport system substrate-binding protein